MEPWSMAAQIEGIEWIVVLIIIAVLLLFGPKKLPELARGIGRSVGEFRKARQEFDHEIKQEIGK